MTSKLIPEFDYLPPEFWSQLTPQQFESFCGNLLSLMFKTDNVLPTEQSGDGGKDFVIKHFEVDSQECWVCNLAYSFGEAKRHHKMNIDGLSRPTISALRDSNCKKLILFISAKLRLSVFTEMYQVLQEKNIELVVIHCAHLTTLLAKPKFRRELENRWKIHTFSNDFNYDEVLQQKIETVTCCFEYFLLDNEDRTRSHRPVSSGALAFKRNDSLILSILVSNMTDQTKTVRVFRSEPYQSCWLPIPEPDERDLDPYTTELFLYKLGFSGTVKSELPKLEVLKTENHEDCSVIISSDKLYAEPYFKPPFCGRKAAQYLLDINTTLKRFTDDYIGGGILIRGQAGTGKSRLVEEVCLELPHATSKLERKSLKVQQGTSFDDIYGFVKTFSNSCLSAHTPGNAPAALFDKIDSKKVKSLLAKKSKLSKREEQHLNHAAKHLADVLFLHKHTAVLLLLDDLHHSDYFVVLWLKALVENLTTNAEGLFIIFSGRNDDTFYNPQFESVVKKIERRATPASADKDTHFHVYELSPFDESETKMFIESIFVRGLSPQALEKIADLSENIPFNIIQITEYLCDSEIAIINSSRTYSIDNPEFFNTEKGFPKKMGALFKQRLKMLKEAAGSNQLNQLLTAVALISSQVSWDKLKLLCNTLSIKTDISLLYSRNFIVSENDKLTFSHENIRHYLTDENVNSVATLRQVSKLLAKSKGIMGNMVQWLQCRIFWWSKSYDKLLDVAAQERGAGDIQSLSHKNNLQDSTKVFDYACQVYKQQSQLSLEESANYLDLLYLKGYSSKFTQSYWTTLTTLNDAIEQIKQQFQSNKSLETQQNELKLAKLNQMAGHTAQNCMPIDVTHSYLTSVQDILFRFIEMEFQLDEKQKRADYLELKYDNQDRIRKNHMFRGDINNAEKTLLMAQDAAKKNNDMFSLAITGLSKAELYFVNDPPKAFKLWADCAESIKEHADDRIKMTYELIKMQKAILQRQLAYIEVEARLSALRIDAEKNGWVGPQPKNYLLKGLNNLIAGEFEQCCLDFEKAHGIAEENGYVMFMWMSLNNWALALAALGENKEAREKIKTAVKRAEKQHFLKYLHEAPICFFQNALIHNFINICEFSEPNKIKFELAKIGISYDNYLKCENTHEIFKLPNTDQYMMTFI